MLRLSGTNSFAGVLYILHGTVEAASPTALGSTVGPTLLREGVMAHRLTFNDAPLRVYWETTDACDLACRHCRAEAIVQRAKDYLLFVGPSYMAFGFAIVLGNALVGAGATRLALRIDLVLVLAVQAPLMLAVTAIFHAPPSGLWTSVVAVNIVRSSSGCSSPRAPAAAGGEGGTRTRARPPRGTWRRPATTRASLPGSVFPSASWATTRRSRAPPERGSSRGARRRACTAGGRA